MKRGVLLGAALLLAGPAPFVSAAGRNHVPQVDFTQGADIPEGASHDWNLGATGARGWMHSERLSTHAARQIKITHVAKGSPADGILQQGDVLLGVEGTLFSSDARKAFGQALTRAESDAGKGRLSIVRWRDGATQALVITLPVTGTYSRTAPYACPKSEHLLQTGCAELAARLQDPATRIGGIPRMVDVLALLASGDPAYHGLIKTEAARLAEMEAGGRPSWYYPYAMMVLAEYQLATGDKTYFPGLRRIAMETAEGQGMVGVWGHKFARPDGRLYGYGAVNATSVPLAIGMVLAREAGVNEPVVDQAIDRTLRFLRFYVGKGSIPYGDHSPWTQHHENNGVNGETAVLFRLVGDQEAATYFTSLCVMAHEHEREQGHTGNFFNILWALPAVAQAGSEASGAWMQEFGQWYFDLARTHAGSYVHLGPPQKSGDKYGNWDASGTYLLAYALPRQAMRLTGKGPKVVHPLDRPAAQQLVELGRATHQMNTGASHDAFDTPELLRRLGNPSATIRERAAKALTRRADEATVGQLMALLEHASTTHRLGAATALGMMGSKANAAVPTLKNALQEDDLWLRVKAAEALSRMGDAGRVALPDLLQRIVAGPSEADPRGMEQRFVAMSVFGNMLRRSIDGVDRDLLRRAMLATLKNEDGRARSAVGALYPNFTYEELAGDLPALTRSIEEMAPSGIMFSDGIRLSGVEFLAKGQNPDALPMTLDLMEADRWNRHARIKKGIQILRGYGADAAPALPRLKALAERIEESSKRRPPDYLELLQKLIAEIEAKVTANS